MGWRIRNFFRKLTPFLIIGALAFGGYYIFKGSFKNTYSFNKIVSSIPYFGKSFSSKHTYKKAIAKSSSKKKIKHYSSKTKHRAIKKRHKKRRR